MKEPTVGETLIEIGPESPLEILNNLSTTSRSSTPSALRLSRTFVSNEEGPRAEPATGMSTAPVVGILRSSARESVSKLKLLGDASDAQGKGCPTFQIPSVEKIPNQDCSTITGQTLHDITSDRKDYLRGVIDKSLKKSFPPVIQEFGPKVSQPLTWKQRNTISSKARTVDQGQWRPTGTVVANFTEHHEAVNCLLLASDESFFLSASDDQTVKVWDCERLEKNVSSKSRATYQHGLFFLNLIDTQK